MQQKSITLPYEEYSALEELAESDRELMQAAIAATANAYSPYSHFSVGAAVRLADGTIVTGSNQENIAYPSGLCAERTALFAAGAHYPALAVESIAIVGRTSEGALTEASPCGACRQVMSEVQMRYRHPLRTFMYQRGGGVRIVGDASLLLPFSFTM